jgi:hypothetical protein
LRDGLWALQRGERWQLALAARVFQILMAVAPRIRRCADPKCGRVFLSRKRQVFCTAAHGTRMRMAKKRAHASKRERERLLGRRRAAYAERRRKLYGPKL